MHVHWSLTQILVMTVAIADTINKMGNTKQSMNNAT